MPRDFIEKPLPSALDAEKAILGAILLDDVIGDVVEHLAPDDFYSPFHRRVFKAMLTLFENNLRVDPMLIGEEIKKETSLDSIGGVPTITDLSYGIPHFLDLGDYIRTVKDKSIARKLIRICAQTSGEALAEEDTSEVLLDRAEQNIYNLRDSRQASSVVDLGRVIVESFNEAKERAKSDTQTLGLQTGFADFDYLTAGLQKTDLIVIAARPSMGKSSLALDIVRQATRKNLEIVCAVFSLEMSQRQCSDRMLCAEALIDSNRYRLGKLSPDSWSAAALAATDLSQRNIFIDDASALSVLEIKAKARHIAARNKRLDLIVVDYMQLMESTRRHNNRNDEVSEQSRGLKALAKDMGLPVIALSQLSRECEKRADKRPMLSDLRESGSIEQDADIVAFIYRDEYYNEHSTEKGTAELIVRKHRNGETGTIKLGWLRQYAKFTDLAR